MGGHFDPLRFLRVKEVRSDIYSKVTGQVTFEMMLEHSKNLIDMRKINGPSWSKFALVTF